MTSSRDKFASEIVSSFKSIKKPSIEKFICIGSHFIKFIFYDEKAATILLRPFQHLAAAPNDYISFSIYVADGTLDIPSPRLELITEPGMDLSKNQFLYFNSKKTHMLHNTQTSITSLVNESLKQAYYYIDELENLPNYEKAAPFRMIFHWFCTFYGMNLIHGAMIIKEGMGWLLAGRGGAGKSTLTLLSYINGTSILGDDYIIIDNKDKTTAYSLYNSIKVNPDIVESYPFLDHYLANRDEKSYEKCYLFADEIPGEGMALKANIKGIIMISGERASQPGFNRIESLKALSVIGSSSVLQMPGINRDFLKGISLLVKSLEIYEFILGYIIDENLSLLSDFIEEKPLISIIMPVYNGSGRLGKSISSVLNQSYSNIELIVVDDGSTDTSRAIVNGFTDTRIKYHYQDNKGPAAARNYGIILAKGRYIAFIDHDDTWYNDKLEKQLEYIRNHPGFSVLYCRHHMVFEGSEDNYKWPQKIGGVQRFNYELPSSMFIDRNVFHRIGMYNSDYRVLEDTEFHMRILDSGIRTHTMDDYLFDKYIDGTDPSRNDAANTLYVKSLFSSSVKRKHFIKNMRISVIIPAYNPDQHLISCIKSILAQTLQPYEIIITDDGSKNDVKALLSCFADERIKIFRQDNKGISGARNLAISKSTGNILAFIDSDDLWTDRKLELQTIRLISDSSVQAVFGHIRQFYSSEVDNKYRNKYYFEDKKTKGIIPGTLVIKKEDFLKTGMFNENLRLGELFDWIHRFKNIGFKYSIIPDIIMYRRLHYNNNGILNKKDRVDFAKAFAQIIKDKKNGKD